MVKYILPYHKQFAIRRGKIILRNKLDMNKYKTAVLNILLLKRPRIENYNNALLARANRMYIQLNSPTDVEFVIILIIWERGMLFVTPIYNSEHTPIPHFTQ